jgi:hypothetical protein
MLIESEIDDIMLIINTAKECHLQLISYYPMVANVDIFKDELGTRTVKDSGVIYQDKSLLRDFIRDNSKEYHLFRVIKNISLYDASSGYCDHEYVNVSFRFEKLVCKKCNKEKV